MTGPGPREALAKAFRETANANTPKPHEAFRMSGSTKQRTKRKKKLPSPLALAFKRRAYLAGVKGPKALHQKVVAIFGEGAAAEVTFKRLFSKGVLDPGQSAAIQAAEVFGCAATDLATDPGPQRSMNGRKLERETSKLMPTIDRAADATLGDHSAVISVSERLMDSQLGSLHAFLTFYLADKLQAQDATGGP